jgi:gamma-glutamyltranspeptidase/glutathione hydrolase
MLRNGVSPSVGQLYFQPALADTLERIGRLGRAGFYEGPVADDMVTKLQSLGGSQTLDDFAAAEGEWIEPIHSNYRGLDLLECPPNGQGIVPLTMLNILSEMDVFGGDPLSVERVHAFLEASKLAYGDRDALLADPRHMDVAVDKLLSKAHADAHRARIDPSRAGRTPACSMPASDDTIYLSVVDGEGNAVSFINSIFENFGSGIMAPKSGVMFHNRGYSFRLEAEHPNVIAPGKRPLHTIIPAMVMKDGLPVMPFGVMGGHYQAFGQAWMLSNIADYGMSIQEAQDCARLFVYHGEVTVENRFPEATISRLVEMGHSVSIPDSAIGGSQGIWIDRATGILAAGSDSRKDGCALAF